MSFVLYFSLLFRTFAALMDGVSLLPVSSISLADDSSSATFIQLYNLCLRRFLIKETQMYCAQFFVSLAALKVLSFFLRFATKASPSSPSAEMKSKKMFFVLHFAH